MIDLINWAEVSKKLTGNPDYLRKSWVGTEKMPIQYRKKISELLSVVEVWAVSNK